MYAMFFAAYFFQHNHRAPADCWQRYMQSVKKRDLVRLSEREQLTVTRQF